MNKRLKTATFLVALIVLMTQSLIAQSTTGRRSTTPPAPTTFELIVNCNVQGATVSINNGAATGVTNYKGNFASGVYVVNVSAPGYTSMTQRVNLRSNQTINIQLQASTVQLNVTSNINGALIQVYNQSGNSLVTSGNAPFRASLPKGNYRVSASADRYTPVDQRVNLQSAQTINLQLQLATAKLNVTSNVNGAQIQVNSPGVNSPAASGNAPYQTDLPLGTYTVTASAPGYTPQTKELNHTRHSNVHFNLKAANGTVQIIIPPESLNKKDVNARNQIRIYDNGALVEGFIQQLRPGQHTIQIVSGGLMTQTTFNVEAGVTYTLKPVLTLTVE
ncbi:MAG: PEGA domain-containing protein [Spirochaetaceae bacterium]|nr:PEGA domain-containing protein [Spirochaetaceae bacterium]